MSPHKTNSDYLLALLNELLPSLTRLHARTGNDPGVEALTKLLLTVWNRHQDVVCMKEMREMMEAEGDQEKTVIELEDYSDFEMCIAELKHHCG